jgi:hypothetical protein
MRLQARKFLKIIDYAELIPRLGIAAGTEHADEALWLRASRLPELFNPMMGDLVPFDLMARRLPIIRW